MFEDVGQFGDDRDSITEFLYQVKSLLIRIAFEEYFERIHWLPDQSLVFEEHHLDLYQRALGEYMDSGRFEALIGAVHDLSDESLTNGGLYGAQLEAKREMVRVSERRFLAGPTGRLFRRLLQAIDVVLGSILDATPVGSALEELKDMAGLLPDER